MIEDKHRIGQQIRDLRKAKGISLSTLATTIGRSVGYMSQVERGVSEVKLSMLQSISDALGVSISWFFHASQEADSKEADYIVRHNLRRSLDLSGSGITEQLLSPRLSGQLQLILTTIAPGATTGPDARRRDGEEAGYLQSGSLELQIGENTFQLEAGDSFSLVGDEPHRCHNSSEEDAVIVWVITPPSY
ncbi:helix-turn-helix domain-containing protein [Leucothrix pacifica]|uniref:Cro/Cl family transcriptional regulator n=1 Tax=Leucothrix pacifica TaxID=1247513 RepID=A0A317CT41_9GAMM|nr:cupin domain-containing protein [Leucothrix pacifica]PWR00694.1 Cro/Cl family transcriptional regulator [Leucothrix pacifica]